MSSYQHLVSDEVDRFTTSNFTTVGGNTAIYLDVDSNNSSLLVKTNDTSALYIDKFQNVGINTIAPSAQLDINSASSSHIQLTYNNSLTNKANIGVSSDGKLLLSAGGSEVSIDNSTSLNVKSHNGSTLGLMLGNSLVLATANQLNYNVVTPGQAANSKSLVLNSSGSITGINSLSATTLVGTVTTDYQPNVTSVDTFDITGHNGVAGLSLGGVLVTASAAQLNYVDTTLGVGAASKALSLDDSRNVININSLTAAELTGTLQTAAQPNITSVGTLTGLDISGSLTGLTELSINTTEVGSTLVLNDPSGNTLRMFYDAATSTTKYVDMLVDSSGGLLLMPSSGNVDIVNHDGSTKGLKLGGVLVTATADQINYLQGTTPGVAAAGKALIVNGSRDISNINALTATSLTGTIQTAAQPNITSVTTLDVTGHNGTTAGLRLGGVLLTATAEQLNSIFGAGGTGTFTDLTVNNNLTLPNANGTSGLILGSTLVTASGTELNYLDGSLPGTVVASKAVVVDANKDIASFRNLTAVNLTGTIQTAAQPLITSVGTLTSITTSGTLTMGSTTISETEIATLDGVTAGVASASKAVILDAASSVTGITSLSINKLTLLPTVEGGSSNGITFGDITITEAEMAVLDGVTPGTVTASKALVVDANKDISSLRNLVATSLTGTIQTAAQPNITSLGTLTSITTSGTLTIGSTIISESEIGLIDSVTAGTASASKAIVLDSSKNVSGINSLSATSVVAGSLTVGSTVISESEIALIDSVVAGTVSAGKAVVVDANKDISSFRNLTAVTLTGAIQTAAQPLITSLGTLTSLAVAGDITVGSTVISETDIAKLDGVVDGTASANKILVLDSSKDIAGINAVSSTKLSIGTPIGSDLPVEVGFVSYQYTGGYAYNSDTNAHGLILAGGGVVSNYSARFEGRVLCQGEIQITSDRRLKKNIIELTSDFAKDFVMTTKPVKFNWRTEDQTTDYGYIAQDVCKAGFNDLVSVVPQIGMEGSVEEDGFVNPQDAKLVFSPGKIIPLLALNQRKIFEELEEKEQIIKLLEERVDKLLEQLS